MSVRRDAQSLVESVDAEAGGEDARLAKVARLRAAIERGEYFIAAEDLADRLLPVLLDRRSSGTS
jgi:anti-sigma28 factor (negative regulator of flagellin synthesis)